MTVPWSWLDFGAAIHEHEVHHPMKQLTTEEALANVRALILQRRLNGDVAVGIGVRDIDEWRRLMGSKHMPADIAGITVRSHSQVPRGCLWLYTKSPRDNWRHIDDWEIHPNMAVAP